MKSAKPPATVAGLAHLLKQVELELSADEMADMLWLAMQIGSESVPSEQSETQTSLEVVTQSTASTPLPPPSSIEPPASVYTSATKPQRESGTASPVLPFRAPAAPALPNKLAIARALRPLMRKVPSRITLVLDEEATAVQIAEKQVWSPVLCPAPERWLELAIVIEDSASLPIWEDTIAEFQQLMERQGAFRDVRTWYLQEVNGSVQLAARKKGNDRRSRSPKELLDVSKRRLILVVSDCTSQTWRSGRIKSLLDQWAKQVSVTVLQLLPEPLWERSALGAGIAVGLSADHPGMVNLDLRVDELPGWIEVDAATELKLPIITLEPQPLQQWARVIAGRRQSRTAGVVLDNGLIVQSQDNSNENSPSLSAEDRVNRFWATASPSAKRLAGLMAATQVSLPIVHLIQRELMPQEASPVHIAEVFMSGLLYRCSTDTSHAAYYDFYDGVRNYLVDATRRSDTEAVLQEVILKRLSQFIEERTGVAIRSFEAFLAFEPAWDETIQQEIAPFAEITRQVLRRLGGSYAELADRMSQPIRLSPPGTEPVVFPPLQEFEFETELLELEETELLEPFEFEVATIEIQRQGIRRQPKVVIQKERRQALGYVEPLEGGVNLEMVAIPDGTFQMGSPENEPERFEAESPQHEVRVSAFFMGKYPVTQAQWRVVAGLPQVERSLEVDPSNFKGEDRPVEQVSWLDAVEFCARLSEHTGKLYRLPSEAEWEYACRAGTTTPFHFGETIAPDLANYNWSETYNKIKLTKKKDFEGTTPVGQFGIANCFGLYDMHGNVWEWCADHWHNNYEGAPIDESAWIDESLSEQASYVLRGGSWYYYPRHCRSASRGYNDAGIRGSNFGFRVVCLASRTS